MIRDPATAVRCATAALILIGASLAALHSPTPSQIVADAHRSFQHIARQP